MKFYLELKLKKEPYSFGFKFSSIQPMFQHQPPPQAVPSNAPRDTVCLIADGALRDPIA